MTRPSSMPNPDLIWPDEAMRAAMTIDAIAGLYPVPTMAQILSEAAEEREALREAFDRLGVEP